MWLISKIIQLPVGRYDLTGILACAAMILCLPQAVDANNGVFTCASTNGSIIFQDGPCALEPPALQAAMPVETDAFGIHESWFALPEQVDGRAFCDRSGCECGSIERKHQGGLTTAVADALYLDGTWHRYNEAYREWLNLPTSSTQIRVKREEMLEASCEVMMSQQLLRSFSSTILNSLTKRSQEAEERGFDRPEPCEQGVPQACEYYNSVQLQRQMLEDAAALQQPRAPSKSSGN